MANFGHTTGDGTEEPIVAAKPAGAAFLLTSDADLWAIKILLRKAASGTAKVTAGVYTETAHVPHDRVVDSDEVSVAYHATVQTWYTFTLDTLFSGTALTTYWFVYHADSTVRPKYVDSGGDAELVTAATQTYVSGATPVALTATIDDVYPDLTANIYGVGLYRPYDFIATRNGSQIDLTWACAADADRTGYDLYRSDNGAGFAAWSTATAAATTKTDDTVVADHVYQYEIRAKTAANQGAFVVSAVVSMFTDGTGAGTLALLGVGT
jgi:hypothetical protein